MKSKRNKNLKSISKFQTLNSKFHSGITLIALVVTVVVLLILAGITITMVFGDNGILKVAQDAGAKQEIAALRERIETIRIAYWTKKKVDNSIGLDNFWNELVKANIITDKDDEDQIQGLEAGVNNTEIYTVMTNDGYSVEIIVDSNGNVTIGEIEKATNLTPKIRSIAVTNKTKTSIAIRVLARLQGGEVKAYYKKASEVIDNEPEASTEGYTEITLDNLEGTASPLTAGEEYKIKVILKNGEEVVDVKSIEVTVLEEGQIPYSWEELNKIAEAISNNTSYNENTENISVTVDGEPKTLKVGDWTRVEGKKVRILGFNHDTLTSDTAYEGRATETGKAGISFEFIEFLGDSHVMNSSGGSSNGWGGNPVGTNASEMRTYLNGNGPEIGGEAAKLTSITSYIKKVSKPYALYGETTATRNSEDWLWLLSASEIWNSGATSGANYGYSKSFEGARYAFYKKYVSGTGNDADLVKKVTAGSDHNWWLRSPDYNNSGTFCLVLIDGIAFNYSADGSYYVAPGFCI